MSAQSRLWKLEKMEQAIIKDLERFQKKLEQDRLSPEDMVVQVYLEKYLKLRT